MKKLLASSFVAILFATAINISSPQNYQSKSLVADNSLAVNPARELLADDSNTPYALAESFNTHFEINNSQYLNIRLDSTERIKASVESFPEIIIIRIFSGDNASSSAISISGLSPSTEYHKYEDGYDSHEVIASDEQGNYSYVQNISDNHTVFIQPRASTIFISDNATGGDCVLKNIGIWNTSDKTCVLTGDLNETVQIQNNGITLDGNGYSIAGKIPATGNGVYINKKSNITIKNLKIRNFSFGIAGATIANSNIINNTIESTYHGILIDFGSSYNKISNNSVSSTYNGINAINGSNNNTIANNSTKSNANYGIFDFGFDNTYTNNTIESNKFGIYLFRIGSAATNNKIYNNNFINNSPYQAYNQPAEGNIYNLDAPIGGNFWSNWPAPDINNDRFVDIPFIFFGGRDNLPWTAQNAWLDNIAPTSTMNISGTANDNNWYSSAVEISLEALDNEGGTGIDRIEYGWDGLTWSAYAIPFTINNQGISKFYYRAVDKANNFEAAQIKEIKIDLSAPESKISLSGNTGTNSWYVSDVTAVITAIDADNGSGLDYIEYSFDGLAWNAYSSVFAVSNEGETTIFYRSADKTGNIEQFKIQTINIDKTSPVISGKPSQAPNQFNWFNQNVTVEFACSDMISGVLNPLSSIIVNTEGANQQASGQCADKAGNLANLLIDGLNIDKTSPQVSVLRSPDPNSKGWNNTPVVATFAATDGLSNINGPATETANFNLEGTDQQASRIFTDKAGNQATGNVSGINIDLTDPVITGSIAETANNYGWYGANVTAHFSGSDILSGIASITPDIILSSEGAEQEAIGTAIDIAGNSAAYKIAGINIDKTSPVITGFPTTQANSNNWYNADVEIKFNASDILSGIASISPVAVISQEGNNLSAVGNAIDKAGNGSSTEVGGINIDKTAPITELTLSTSGKCSAGTVNVSFAATDNLSGVAKTAYNLNGKGWVDIAENLYISDAGVHNLSYKSYDKADNIENERKKSFTIENDLLEAAIKFDPVKKDLVVYNTTNGNEADFTIIQPNKFDNGKNEKNENKNREKEYEQGSDEQGWVLRKYQIKDCSDNLLAIVLKYKKEGKELKAKIVSLQYNSEKAIIARENSINIEYSLNKQDIIKELTQIISAKNKFDLNAKYKSDKNQTAIIVKLPGKNEKKQIKTGMIILEMTIKDGSLQYKY